MQLRSRTLLAAASACLLLSCSQKKADTASLPPKVLATFHAKFSDPQIQSFKKETEEGRVIYDIEFLQAGQKMEADIFEDGSIQNWEKAIALPDLPAAVTDAINARYPHSSLKEAMVVTAVKEGKDVLEGYEIVVVTADKKDVEVAVAPDGKFQEDPGAKKDGA